MTPYRGVRYHLKECKKANQQPQYKNELFNLRHSSLRTVISKKNRFVILTNMDRRGYSFDAQRQLILCVVMIPNYMRYKSVEEDQLYQNVSIREYDAEDNVHEPVYIGFNNVESIFSKTTKN